MLLLRGREAVMSHFRPSLQEHGVTEQQWRVLRALSSVKEMEVLMLASATFLFASSMSRILKDLQRRGLINRRDDQNDLRRNLVAINQKGMELIELLSPRSEVVYNEIYQRFGEKNFKRLQELLRELETKLQADELAIPAPERNSNRQKSRRVVRRSRSTARATDQAPLRERERRPRSL